jgi:hypothetical protein
MAEKNSTIMAAAYLEGTSDFQQRIPDPSKSGLKATITAIMDPMNRIYYNQFCDVLINRISQTYIQSKRWDNPLAVFKRSNLEYGSTVQEIGVKWIKAHSYDDNAGEQLLKLERPEYEAVYHSVNRRDQYKISLVHDELRTAFADAYGLDALIQATTAQPLNADAYDEYLIMRELIAYYEDTFGMFRVNVGTVDD